MIDVNGTYPTKVGSQAMNLPIAKVDDDLAIALLITVDHGLSFCERAGSELADLLRPLGVERVVSVATMGIPLAIEVSRALQIDDYLIFHKTPKIYLADAVAEPVKSITTGAQQRLLLDRARIASAAGHRVALVDDVVSTGGSIKAALQLLRGVGAIPVAIGTLVTEAGGWQKTLGDDAELVVSLGEMPVFRRNSAGDFEEDWGRDSD